MLGRTVLGLTATVAAMALLVPVASADPQSDAAGAIDAAWSAPGGDTSVLGAKDGDVYPAGSGFAQNYAFGTIFFTPQTGAHIMFGPVLDKYRALGGPADSDLGFPTMDVGPGRISPDSRNVTFSAADAPVIFWTPDSGAWVVRGAINAAWDALGGSSGVLGVPTADEAYAGDVVSQNFSGGQISYDSRTKKFTTEPPELADQLGAVDIPGDATSAINGAYRAAGGSAGPLGAKDGDQYSIGDNGAGQNFAGGKIFYSPDTGAHALSGAILQKYEEAGGPTGDLGFPNASTADGGVPDSQISSFAAADNPVIFWTQAHGAVIVRGALKAAWDKLGGPSGSLGAPVSDQTGDADALTQKFSNGEVTWHAKDNTFTTQPPNLADSLGGVTAPAGPATPGATSAPAPDKDNALAFHTWWLWWIIPLALLVVASLVVWGITRRRRSAPAQPFGAPLDTDTAYAGGQDRDRWTRVPSGPDPDRRRHLDDDEDSAYAGPAVAPDGWPHSEPAEVAPSPWSDIAPTAPPADDDADLFSQPPAFHEIGGAAAVSEPADTGDTEDPDAVDTAPTRVQSDDDEPASGRHAALPDAGRPAWLTDAVARPGSLFEPVHEATPPPSHHRAEVMEPDVLPEEPDDELYAGYAEEEAVADEPQPPVVEDLAEEPLVPEPVYEQPVGVAQSPNTTGQLPMHLPLEDPFEVPAGYPVKGSMSQGTYKTPDSPTYADTAAEIWFATAEFAEANGFVRSSE